MTIDTAPFWLFSIIIVIGLTLISAGIWGIEKNPTEAQLRYWPTFPAHLAERVAALPNSEAIQEEMRSASRRRSRIMLVGSGAGLICLSGIPLLLQLFLNHLVASVMASHAEFAEELETVPTMVAAGIDTIALGFSICLATYLSVAISRHDRRRERTSIRRVSDIRSPLFLLIPLSPIVLAFTLIGLAANSRAFTTPARQQFVSAVPWIPYLIPSLLVLLFLAVEVCVWSLCHLSPRLWVTEAPEEVIEGADVYVRSRTICITYSSLSFTIGAYLSVQILLIPQFFSALYLSLPLTLAVGFLPIVWYLTCLWLSSVTRMGQLGGRLTGWWWQQRTTPQVAG